MPSQASPFFLGNKALIGYLAFLNGFVPLSTDLYLPALPGMARLFDVSAATANLTLSLFMLGYAASLLLAGPLSDRIGRKKTLYAGLAVYFFASVLCALAPSMAVLILGRVLQAVGSGAIQAASMALVKDTFKGRIMETVLVWIQTMTVICPMVAPLIGATLLEFTSWRGLFWFLGGCSLAAACLAFGLSETLEQRTEGSVFRALSRIGFVLKNREFRNLLGVFSLGAMSFMAYLATSSYIYMEYFGVSQRAYSLFFAANASAAMLGPMIYLRFFRDTKKRPYIATCFGMTALAGALILAFGGLGPFCFAAFFMLVTFCGSAARPVGTVLMMTRLETDNGTVASLIGCSALTMGSLSMTLTGLPWPSPLAALGTIAMLVGASCCLLWLVISRRIRMERVPD